MAWSWYRRQLRIQREPDGRGAQRRRRDRLPNPPRFLPWGPPPGLGLLPAVIGAFRRAPCPGASCRLPEASLISSSLSSSHWASVRCPSGMASSSCKRWRGEMGCGSFMPVLSHRCKKRPERPVQAIWGPPDKAGWVRSIRQLQEHFAVFDFHRKRAGAAGVRRFGAAIFEADAPAMQRAGHAAPEHDSLRQGTAFVRAAIEHGEALAFGVAEHGDVAGPAADDAGAELGDVLEPTGLDPACDARRIARFRKRLRHQAGSASVSY